MVFGELTSGAESDLDQLTTIARYMVGRWGMSASVGMMSALDSDSRGNASPETLALLDVEVRKIADEAYGDIVALLRDERDASTLLRRPSSSMRHSTRRTPTRRSGLVRPVVEDPHPPLTVQDTVSLDEG